MTKNERIQEIQEEIQFLLDELEGLLLESGILAERKRLAIWTNLNLVRILEEELLKLKRE